MATINFNPTPTLNEEYNFGGRTWKYNGIGWALKPNVSTAPPVAGLTTNTFTGDQNFSGKQLINASLTNYSTAFLDKGNSGTGTKVISCTDGNHQRILINNNCTLSFTNWPTTGKTGEIFLELVNGASKVVTWPTINWVKPDGTTTTSFATNGVNLQTSGTDFVLLWTRNGGTTIYGRVMR